MGPDVMQQTIPPPPPGFTIISGGGSPPPAPAARPRSAVPAQPRGLRNNNPGNIEDGAFARNLPGYAGSDGRFARFSTPAAGAQAAPRLLESYLSRGFDTPAEIINRWAPPSDNNPTAAYASYVASRVGVGVNEPVTPDKIPLIAQAISEFENGNTQSGAAAPQAAAVPPPPPGFEIVASPLDDLNIHRPESVDLAAAAAVGDRPSAYTGPGSSQDNPFVLIEPANQEEDFAQRRAAANLSKGMWVRQPDGTVAQLTGDAYVDENSANDQGLGGVNLREENLGDRGRAFAMAAAEQIPFLDEAAVGAAGLLSGRGYSDVRDSYRAVQAIDNQVNRDERIAGGLAGAGLTILAPASGASNFVKAGATGLGQTARASVLGAGGGGLFGAANTDGGFAERARGGLLGAAVGAATGGLLDTGGQAATRAARASADAAPSAQRILSREGVNLTPGQMLQDTPVIGGLIRAVEDNVTGVLPFVQSARNEGVRDLNRAAVNRSLAHIGQTLPRKVEPGYQAVEEAQKRLGAAYNEVLPNVSGQLDQALYDDIAGVLDGAVAEMPEPMVAQLARILQTRVFRNVDQSDATITGAQFKRIESELGALAREYRTAADPSARSLGGSIEGIRSALRDMIARQNPAQAQRIQAINRGYAELVRVERAAGGSAAQARNGVFTGGELSNAVGVGAGRSERARGGALMQDLATAARQVLPNKVGDSGTASRVVGAGLLGGAIPLPQVAIPIIASSLAYSKPAQVALNAIYRATDRQAGLRSLGELQRLASRNPALQPYYADAVQHLQGAFEGPSPAPAPATSGLLSPNRP